VAADRRTVTFTKGGRMARIWSITRRARLLDSGLLFVLSL
jgi:hypothetical protein